MARQKTPFLRRIIVPLLVLIGIAFFTNPNYWISQAGFLLNGRPEQINIDPNLEKMESNLLIIQSLGIRAPIIFVEETNEEHFQKGLENGVVLYPGTASVGQKGNPYIFGHSSDYIWKKGEYKTVFALLPKIEIGSIITASDEHGNAYRYKVVEAFVAESDDVNLLDQGGYEKKILTLQTSYPIGTALKRFIAKAEMIEQK